MIHQHPLKPDCCERVDTSVGGGWEPKPYFSSELSVSFAVVWALILIPAFGWWAVSTLCCWIGSVFVVMEYPSAHWLIYAAPVATTFYWIGVVIAFGRWVNEGTRGGRTPLSRALGSIVGTAVLAAVSLFVFVEIVRVSFFP